MVTIGTFITATKKGMVNATSNTGILGIPYYLLSGGKMQQAQMSIVFNPIGVKNSRNGKIIITGQSMNNLIGLNILETVK